VIRSVCECKMKTVRQRQWDRDSETETVRQTPKVIQRQKQTDRHSQRGDRETERESENEYEKSWSLVPWLDSGEERKSERERKERETDGKR
jgi:hypothetical protein